MSDKLIGEANYVTWANAMRLSLVSNGKITKPTYDEVKSWETVNDVIFSWIINGISPQIVGSLTYAVVWMDLEECSQDQLVKIRVKYFMPM